VLSIFNIIIKVIDLIIDVSGCDGKTMVVMHPDQVMGKSESEETSIDLELRNNDW